MSAHPKPIRWVYVQPDVQASASRDSAPTLQWQTPPLAASASMLTPRPTNVVTPTSLPRPHPKDTITQGQTRQESRAGANVALTGPRKTIAPATQQPKYDNTQKARCGVLTVIRPPRPTQAIVTNSRFGAARCDRVTLPRPTQSKTTAPVRGEHSGCDRVALPRPLQSETTAQVHGEHSSRFEEIISHPDFNKSKRHPVEEWLRKQKDIEERLPKGSAALAKRPSLAGHIMSRAGEKAVTSVVDLTSIASDEFEIHRLEQPRRRYDVSNNVAFDETGSDDIGSDEYPISVPPESSISYSLADVNVASGLHPDDRTTQCLEELDRGLKQLTNVLSQYLGSMQRPVPSTSIPPIVNSSETLDPARQTLSSQRPLQNAAGLLQIKRPYQSVAESSQLPSSSKRLKFDTMQRASLSLARG